MYRRSFWTHLKRNLEGYRPRLSLGLDLFEEGFCLDLFGALIPLTFLDRWRYEPHEIMESWGILLHDRSIHLKWGSKYKFIHLPWDRVHIKHEVRRPDGSWVPYVGTYERDKEPDGRWIATYPYRYTLKSGEVQERQATIYVDRMEWRQKWLKWCPYFATKRKSISVEFDGEVGERTGSWKGGTIGCGYEMRPGELPIDTLRRMEREREFR